MKRRNKKRTIKTLVSHSKSAVFAVIELHNKPNIQYRYEICIVILINSWELLIKAYIYKFLPNVKLFKNDEFTKDFLTCLNLVRSSIGKEFFVTYENLNQLYTYRNRIVHFYDEKIDLLIFSLMKANIIYYTNFIKKYFNIDLASESNLYLLPLGFKSPLSPIDFLSKESVLSESSPAVTQFILDIHQRSQNLVKSGIKESIFIDYKMAVKNVDRIKNADVLAAIDNSRKGLPTIEIGNQIQGQIAISEDGKRVKIDEENLFKDIYKHTYEDLCKYLKTNFVVKLNPEFYKNLNVVKADQNCYRERFLDVKKKHWSEKRLL